MGLTPALKDILRRQIRASSPAYVINAADAYAQEREYQDNNVSANEIIDFAVSLAGGGTDLPARNAPNAPSFGPFSAGRAKVATDFPTEHAPNALSALNQGGKPMELPDSLKDALRNQLVYATKDDLISNAAQYARAHANVSATDVIAFINSLGGGDIGPGQIPDETQVVLSIPEILVKIRTDVTYTREEAIRDLEAAYIRAGADPDDASTAAAQDYIQAAPSRVNFGQGQNLVASDPTFLDSDVTKLVEERPGYAFAPFGEDRPAQLTAFRGFEGTQFPRGLPGVARSALGSQFNAIAPLFNPLRALGGLAADRSFPDFLSANLGQGGIDPQSAVKSIAALFNAGNLTKDQGLLVNELIDRPEGQFELAQASASQGVPAFLARTLDRVLRQRYGQFQTAQAVDPLTGQPSGKAPQFLPYYTGGNVWGR